MYRNEKCLTSEGMDILLWAAQNGAFLSSPEHKEFETICQLVASGHLFYGQAMNNLDSGTAYYSITKKGFAVLQCNFLWNVYDETNAHQHVIEHINECRLDCHQSCLQEKKAGTSEQIKITNEETSENNSITKV
ncbi:hypothetical protein GALL_331220 [mine drainage metagenome]|uniref:Uncharacterized protein n=1 Tax=mine drainage metagenome TaxID=410659 RepID=A0A1J5QNT6_9ZZZZ